MNTKKIQAMKTQLAVNEIFGQFRYIVIEGEIWFVGIDIAKILGYSNTRDALAKHVDDEDKNTVAIYDGIPENPNKVIINESGLYSLIFNSQLPKAKRFKRWITSEVLPSIRKYGKYEMPGEVKEITMEDFLELVFKENPHADFECTGITMEERDGRIVPIYHVGLTGFQSF